MNQYNLVTRTTEVAFQHIPCFYDGLSVISSPAARRILRNKTQEHDRLLPLFLAPLESPQHGSSKALTPSLCVRPASLWPLQCWLNRWPFAPDTRTLGTFF